MIERIVSGGQTGVDRAALDAARKAGVACGGWCPKGRKAEDGPIPRAYPLKETPSADYPQRTEWNVRDSDGTLVLTAGNMGRGAKLTVSLAEKLGKPCLVVDLDENPGAEALAAWMSSHGIRVLNVAGSRESSSPGIHRKAWTVVMGLLAASGLPQRAA